jgi:hypothetical protein
MLSNYGTSPSCCCCCCCRCCCKLNVLQICFASRCCKFAEQQQGYKSLWYSQSTSKHTAFALRHSFSTRSVGCSLGPRPLSVFRGCGSPSRLAPAAATLQTCLCLALLLLWQHTAGPTSAAGLALRGLQGRDSREDSRIRHDASCLVWAGGPSSEYAFMLSLDQALAARRATQQANVLITYGRRISGVSRSEA